MAGPILHFVISAPRSGSTWLAIALNQHPDIFATEHRFFGDFCEMWPNDNGTLKPRLTFDAFARAFAVHYFHDPLGLDRRQFVDDFQLAFTDFVCQFARKRCGKKIIVDKITPYPGTAGTVLKKTASFFPNSKRIHLVRDGRDVAVSGTFDWLRKDARGTDRYQFFVEQNPDLTLTRFFDDQVLTRWATDWRDTNRALADAPLDLRTSYEAMTANQAAVLQQICNTLSVDDSPEIANRAAVESSFEKQTGRPKGCDLPTAKARKGIVGDWKSFFTRRDGEIFQQIAAAELSEFGYATDPAWIDNLPKELCLSNSEFPIA